jgi:MFS family permease
MWIPFSMLSDGLSTLLLPQMLLSIADPAGKSTALGLITFVGLLAGMLIQPVAGAFSDGLRPRWGRRGTIWSGILLILAALTFFGFGAAWGLIAVIIGFLLIQVTTSVTQAAQQGLLPDLVPPAQRGTAAGVKGLMDLSGALFGFVLLGQLLGSGTVTPALLAIGLILLGAGALTTLLVRESPGTSALTGPRTSPWAAFRINLAEHRQFARIVACRFLFLLSTYMVGRFLLFFVADRLALTPEQAGEQTGTLLAGLALVTLIAALPCGWASDRFGRRQLMLLGIGLNVAGVLALIFAASALQIFMFGALMALGSAAFASANWALTADLVPPLEAARFMGLANFGTAGATAAAGLFGPLVDWANGLAPGSGYTALFIAAGVIFLISAVTLLHRHESAQLANRNQQTKLTEY